MDEYQIEKRMSQLKSKLEEHALTFPQYIKSEMDESNLVQLPTSQDNSQTDPTHTVSSEFINKSIAGLFKIPDTHIVEQVQKKTVKTINLAYESSEQCYEICRRIQKDVVKKQKIQQIINLATYIRTLSEFEGLLKDGKILPVARGSEELESSELPPEQVARIQLYSILLQIEKSDPELIDEAEELKGRREAVNAEFDKLISTYLEHCSEEQVFNLEPILKPLGFHSKVFEAYLRIEEGILDQNCRIIEQAQADAPTVKQYVSNIKYFIDEFVRKSLKIKQSFDIKSNLDYKRLLLNKLEKVEKPLIEAYKNENNIEQMVIFTTSSSINEERFQKLDHICEDICSLSHYSSLFLCANSFVKFHTELAHVSSIHESPNSKKKAQLANEIQKQHNQRQDLESLHIQEIISDYIIFEKGFLNKSVRQVISQDEQISSDHCKGLFEKEEIVKRYLSDDTFFVFFKIAQRALYSLNMSTACAIINMIIEALSEIYFPYITKKIEEFAQPDNVVKRTTATSLFSFEFAKESLTGLGSKDKIAGFNAKFILPNAVIISYLNELDMSIKFIAQMKEKLLYELDQLTQEIDQCVDSLQQAFSPSTQSSDLLQSEMFKNCLTFLTEHEKTERKKVNVIMKAIISKDNFSTVIEALFIDLAKLNFDLDDLKYDDYDTEDPFFHKFCQATTKLTKQWLTQLKPELFEQFIVALSGKFAECFLEIALQLGELGERRELSQISLLGALYLSKLVGSMTNFMLYLTQKPTRKEFEKVIEAVQVLGYETKEEFIDYLEIPEAQRILTQEEAVFLLGRRTDSKIFELDRYEENIPN